MANGKAPLTTPRCTPYKHFVPQPGARLCECGAVHAGLTADGKSGIVVRVFSFVGRDETLERYEDPVTPRSDFGI